MAKTAKILFFDKAFLKRKRNQAVRGVELFNLSLMRELLQLGYRVTFVATNDWKEDVREHVGRSDLDCVWLPTWPGTFPNSLLAVFRLALRRFDVLFLANVARGLVPSVRVLKFCRVFKRAVLLAHRESFPYFSKSLKSVLDEVVSVNSVIANAFTREGYRSSHVYYGVMNAERYFPANLNTAPNGIVHFAVLGSLDNKWKGSDTALEAFSRLPEDLRKRAILHLASFVESAPAVHDPQVKIHPWMPLAAVPDFLRTLDVLLVPSRDEHVMRETFSQAMVQGMLCGLPIVANNVPVLTEKLDSGGGIIFKSVAELTEAMAELIEHPAKRRELGVEARKTAERRYVWDTKYFVEKFLL